jgi:isoleucyl-tRNA synthetase
VTVVTGRPLADRWILSRLASTVATVESRMEDYDFGGATQVPLLRVPSTATHMSTVYRHMLLPRAPHACGDL